MFFLRELIPKYKYVRYEFFFNEGDDCSFNCVPLGYAQVFSLLLH